MSENLGKAASYLACLTIDYAPVKIIYSEKATKFCEISTLLLSYLVPVKSKVEILQNFEAFSEYMNFIYDNPISIGEEQITPIKSNKIFVS
jgi:hypothetical protein